MTTANDTACLEGADVAREARAVPLPLDALFDRLDMELGEHGSALVAVERVKRSPIDQPEYLIYECELKQMGRVREIDMEKRARQLGVIDPYVETVLDRWYRPPRYCRPPIGTGSG
jgi:hypothetical protein